MSVIFLVGFIVTIFFMYPFILDWTGDMAVCSEKAGPAALPCSRPAAPHALAARGDSAWLQLWLWLYICGCGCRCGCGCVAAAVAVAVAVAVDVDVAVAVWLCSCGCRCEYAVAAVALAVLVAACLQL